jgi:threonine/homoserine/homoserine lactone efflux protein
MINCDQPNNAWRIFLLAFSVAFTGAATPGPMLALVIGQSLAGGILATLFVLAGHAILELLLVFMLVLGLARFLQKPAVSVALCLIGGAVLIWMGATILGEVPGMSLGVTAAEKPLSAIALVAGGVGVSLSNPYFTGWWATVGAGQIAALKLKKSRDFGLFFIAHEMGDLVWYLAVAAALSLGRTFLDDAAYRAILFGCGFIIMGLGLFFAVLGAVRFLNHRKSAVHRLA